MCNTSRLCCTPPTLGVSTISSSEMRSRRHCRCGACAQRVAPDDAALLAARPKRWHVLRTAENEMGVGHWRVRRIGLCLGALLVLSAVALDGSPARAVGEPVNGFPNWAERVVHEWANRARVDPQVEMNACGAPCLEHACYAAAMPPLTWNEALNRAARYHSDEMVRQGYFAHNSACTVVSNISTLYPATCNGAASCACVGGTKACSPTCTDFGARVERFGGSPSGEIIVSTSDPDQSFYIWLFEPGDTTSCQFTSANGHRWLILKS